MHEEEIYSNLLNYDLTSYVRTVLLKCNIALARQHVAHCTLELDVYHLESASLQLNSHSTLGLQQNFYKARLFNLKLYVIKPFIIVSTYHCGSTHVSQNPSMHRA